MNCPGTTCPGGYMALSGNSFGGGNSAALVLRFRCGPANGCANSVLHAYLNLFASSVTLADLSGPAVQITGGTLASQTWQRGTGTVAYDASDNAGIKLVRAYLDGRPRAKKPRGCNYTSKTPARTAAAR